MHSGARDRRRAVALTATLAALVVVAAGRVYGASEPERSLPLRGAGSSSRQRPSAPSAVSATAAEAVRAGRPLDINVAEAADLELLPGIGPALAGRVLRSRHAEGPFRDVSELARVRGIGPATIERMRPFVTVGGRDP